MRESLDDTDVKQEASRATPATSLRRNPKVLHRVVAGEAVILDPSGGSYFTLNQVGTLVWERLAEPAALGDLHAAVVAEFEVTPEQAWLDVERFIGEVLAAGLVERAGS